MGPETSGSARYPFEIRVIFIWWYLPCCHRYHWITEIVFLRFSFACRSIKKFRTDLKYLDLFKFKELVSAVWQDILSMFLSGLVGILLARVAKTVFITGKQHWNAEVLFYFFFHLLTIYWCAMIFSVISHAQHVFSSYSIDSFFFIHLFQSLQKLF